MEKHINIENTIQSESNESKNQEKLAADFLQFLDTAEGFDFLHGQRFEEIFSDEEHKRKFIESLNEEEFLQLFNSINGVLRGKEKEEWKMDGDGVIISSAVETHIPPEHEDKSVLLAKVLSTAKIMNQEKRDLKDIALLISASANALHAYADGNGRTSRSLYLLLTKDFDDETKNEIKEALSDEGRDKIDISPSHIELELRELIYERIMSKCLNSEADKRKNYPLSNCIKRDLDFDEEINEKNKKIFLENFRNDYFNLIINEFLRNNSNLDIEKYLENYKDRKIILTDVFVKDLNSEKITQILQSWKNIRVEKVERLIDCIANPEKPEYQIQYKGKQISLKDYFESKIKENQSN